MKCTQHRCLPTSNSLHKQSNYHDSVVGLVFVLVKVFFIIIIQNPLIFFFFAQGLKGDSGFDTDGSGDSFAPGEKVFLLMDLFYVLYNSASLKLTQGSQSTYYFI